MKSITGSGANPSGPSRRFSRRRLSAATAAIALVATGAFGAHSFADGEEAGTGPTPPPGEPFIPDAPDGGDVDSAGTVVGTDTLIQTSGSSFDETIVTKYIPATSFQVLQGSAVNADLVAVNGGCYSPDSGSGGTLTFLQAGVELPDGARIKRLTLFGADTAAGASDSIDVALRREEYTSGLSIFPFPASVTRQTPVVVDNFSTSGAPGELIVSGADNLAETAGSPAAGLIFTNFPNRFHTIEVSMNNVGTALRLCGVRVDYQVPVAADVGTVFHPLDPVRAFDSRIASLPQSGRLGPNQTKVIDITDGYDSTGAAIPAQNNVVPTTATAVAYNITIAGADGPNFVAVTAGDAAAFTASAINYSAGSNVANGSSVAIAADQTIKLWGGNNTGSSHVIVDIVGYYSPPVLSNMAN